MIMETNPIIEHPVLYWLAFLVFSGAMLAMIVEVGLYLWAVVTTRDEP